MSDSLIEHVSDPLTWRELCERFPDQWVSLVGIEWVDDNDTELRMGLVAGVGSRREARKQARPLRSVFRAIGQFFTGADTAPEVPLFLHVT
ncbi:MAG: hypothetical protein WKG01_05045 [Kofleriaceae bacterium]